MDEAAERDAAADQRREEDQEIFHRKSGRARKSPIASFRLYYRQGDSLTITLLDLDQSIIIVVVICKMNSTLLRRFLPG